MTEATCKREIELEIPAANVSKASEKAARDIARVARIPGFRPGKAPVTIIRRQFAADIQGEVLQSLVPEYLEKALDEQKLTPITRPEVDKVEFKEGEPLKFRAVFEVLPEFELGEYKNLAVQIDPVEAGEVQVDQAIEEMRERSATFVPIEDRPAKDGDFVLMKLNGAPVGEGEPVEADNIMCHVGAEETLESFTEKLKGKTYDYVVEVQGVKEKKLPEVNDDFAKEVAGEAAGINNLADMRKKILENLEASKEQQQSGQAKDRILEELVKKHDFPVPQALVEHQMDVRLERAARSLAAQGVDPRTVNVDWMAMRKGQQDRAINDVKAELILDRISTAEKIDATDEDVDKELALLAENSGESATTLRARLTKQGALDRMKSKLRSDKTIDWLYRNARIETTAKSEK